MAAAFDSDATTAALLRLAASSASTGDTAEGMRCARTLFLAWLIDLPAGTELDAARAARPGLSNLAADPIMAAVLQLIDRLLATPTRLSGRRRRGNNSRVGSLGLTPVGADPSHRSLH